MITKIPKISSLIFILICFLMMDSTQSLRPQPLTKKIYTQKITKNFGNIHYFIANSRTIYTQELLKLLNQYAKNHQIQIYVCNPTDHKDICSLDTQIVLFINTIKIQYNGRHNHPEDVFKWVKFRVGQYPRRLHSIEQLKDYVKDKNQVYCFIDRQGQAITKKEYIFISTAKKLHFLHYCSLDVQIAKPIGLRQGHLALIRRDLTYNFDYWSLDAHEDNQQLHQLWLNFLIKSCQDDFRLQNRNKTHDLVTIQCDFSLQCQEQLYTIFLAQLKWRAKHPDVNFKINLFYGTTGQLKASRNIVYDLPLIKYGQTNVQKRIVHQQSGAVLQETHYQRDIYMKKDPVIDQNTIDRLLEQYKQKKLQFVIHQTSTDIRPLQADQAQPHRQRRAKQKEKEKEKSSKNQDL